MRTRVVLVAVWLVGTVASIALAWTAVSFVGGGVTSPPAGGLSTAQVAAAASAPVASTTTAPTAGAPGTLPVGGGVPAPASTAPPRPAGSSATTTSTTTVVTPRPTAPPAGEPTSSQTFGSTGGSAGVRCTGNSAALQFATPQAGYATEVHDGGPATIDVRFDNRERESRILVTCTAGMPDAEIRED